MSQRHLLIAGAILAALIVAGFLISVPHTTRDVVPTITKVAVAAPTVALRDTYKSGKHTIKGSFTVPTPCTTASTTALLAGADAAQSILITVDVPADTGVCLQVPTPFVFSTSLVAPANLPITVKVNGLVASTTTL